MFELSNSWILLSLLFWLCVSLFFFKDLFFDEKDANASSDLWWKDMANSKHNNLIIPPNFITRKFIRRIPSTFDKIKTVAIESVKFRSKKLKIDSDSGSDDAYLFKNLPSSCTPLLVFVNTRSGGSQGLWILHQLQSLLNPNQVFDLRYYDPKFVLNQFYDAGLINLRVLVCGGDGTVSWIMSAIESSSYSPLYYPAIAILPLGTGNDLSRVLGWGGCFTGSLSDYLSSLSSSSVIMNLDRWEMICSSKNSKITKSVIFNNYYGIGVDAQAALRFHTLRNLIPGLFFHRFINKIWYTIMGFTEILRKSCQSLPEYISLTVDDGVEVKLPENTEGLIIININSYAGGAVLWENKPDVLLDPYRYDNDDGDDDNKSFGYSSMQDGMLEIVAVVSSLHLGQSQVGLSTPIKIAQCRKLCIKSIVSLPMQYDGEPWLQPPSTTIIQTRPRQAQVMRNTLTLHHSTKMVRTVLEAIEAAHRKRIINDSQLSEIQREISMRIENRQIELEDEEEDDDA